MQPSRQFWCCLLAAVVVAACAPVPRAFKPGEEQSVRRHIVEGTFTKGIQVDPLEGTAKLMGDLIARTTVDSFEPYGLPAGVAPFDASEFILHGRAQYDRNPNAIPYVTLHWQLSNKDGQVLADLEQPVDATSGEWEFGTPEVIIRVAEDVAKRVAAVLAGIAPAQEKPAPDKGIFVAPVEEAPGDGDFSLTRAIAEALKQRGTRLTRFREQAKYVLEGKMKISPPVGGRQGVAVTWRLTLPDGSEVGKAQQENTVPAGTFDTRWGPTARQIAAAAVDGIHDVIAGWERKENLTAGRAGLGLPESLDGSLPKPGQGPRLLGKLEDHVVPADAPVSREPAPKEDAVVQASARTDAAAPPATASPPTVKSVLGPTDAGGEKFDETFSPPTLPTLQEGDPNSFLIAEVSGAPGNGNDLLAQALKQVLRARDQEVTEDPRQARFIVRGLVVMSEPKDGRQTARVVWSVATAEGKELGSAEQRSKVAAGALDQDWGNTAMDVAIGAAVGLQRVLGDRARPFAMKAQSGAKLPQDAVKRSLPWSPGEAIPPPTR